MARSNDKMVFTGLKVSILTVAVDDSCGTPRSLARTTRVYLVLDVAAVVILISPMALQRKTALFQAFL